MTFFEGLFLNTLPWWLWAVILAAPPLVVLLYFLKLVRQPLEVPSTFLWQRTIEDLHVNSLWQTLKNNILLILQLLLLCLAIVACLRPGWSGTQLVGQRFIFLLDTSASMGATDVTPTRFAQAKRQIGEMIDRLEPGQVAMLISFSDTARIEQSFTENRTLLHRKLEAAQLTTRRSDIREALTAASGLANPGDSGSGSDEEAARPEPLPATVFLFSDGRFPPIPKFEQGNLTFRYVPQGLPEGQSQNLAIAAFTVDRNPEKPDQLQAFARLENYGPAEREVEVGLYQDDALLDAAKVKVAAGGSAGLDFDLAQQPEGTLTLQIEHPAGQVDHLAADDVAYLAFQPPRRLKVLLVTPQDESFTLALSTSSARRLAELTVQSPDILATAAHQKEAAVGAYDLIVYDRCAPPKLPQANTLFLGALPPDGRWKRTAEKVGNPAIIDVSRTHPLMQYVELGNVKFYEVDALAGPAGLASLIDADAGTIFGIAPRDGYQDAVFGFALYSTETKNGQTERFRNTDWPLKISFAIFVNNLLAYFGAEQGAGVAPALLPGDALALRADPTVQQLSVASPVGRIDTLARGSLPSFQYTATDALGVYLVRAENAAAPTQRFSVNLFDAAESNLAPRAQLDLGGPVEDQSAEALRPARFELWRWLLVLGLIVLALEWYIYNRRVAL